MSPPEDGSLPGSTGPPDRQILRLLETHLASDPLVDDTAFQPNHSEPRSLQVRLDEERYPSAVSSARIDVRWFESGDFSFHYVERQADGGRWECRWDRYPSGHSARSHFHRPPDASEVEDLTLPSQHPLEVYSTVLDAVEQRVEQTWE